MLFLQDLVRKLHYRYSCMMLFALIKIFYQFCYVSIESLLVDSPKYEFQFYKNCLPSAFFFNTIQKQSSELCKICIFQVPYGVALTTVTYTLSVNGTGGTNFSETKYVRFMEKGFSIYIQTDKAVYKPGQKGNLAYYTPL